LISPVPAAHKDWHVSYQADEFFADVEKVIFGLGYQY
jgi:hypothetical protein